MIQPQFHQLFENQFLALISHNLPSLSKTSACHCIMLHVKIKSSYLSLIIRQEADIVPVQLSKRLQNFLLSKPSYYLTEVFTFNSNFKLLLSTNVHQHLEPLLPITPSMCSQEWCISQKVVSHNIRRLQDHFPDFLNLELTDWLPVASCGRIEDDSTSQVHACMSCSYQVNPAGW